VDLLHTDLANGFALPAAAAAREDDGLRIAPVLGAQLLGVEFDQIEPRVLAQQLGDARDAFPCGAFVVVEDDFDLGLWRLCLNPRGKDGQENEDSTQVVS
jgi:hypothetical protein